nr:DPP IV N-terminal domain-containing protein [Sphingomonas jejuensis]
MVIATPAAADDLTLERIFASPSLSGPQPRGLKLSPDGRWLTSLRNRPDDRERYDLWATDTTTGESRMVVDSQRIGSGAELSEEEKMQRERARIGGTRGIVAYDWAPDGRSILVPLDGDLFIAALDGSTRRLTETPGTELDATVSPQGGFVSFVRDQNLFVQPLAGGAARALTTDGGDALSWGVAEFVAQEEMGRSRGHWWSPDDRRVAVARVDESGVRVISRAAIGADGTRVYQQRYPQAGTPNAVVQLWVLAADGSGRVQVDLGNDPDIYLARVDWAPDGSKLIVQRETRDQKRLDVLLVDPDTGRSEVLFTERAERWINLHDNLKPLSSSSLLWTSERDGYSHIYRFDAGRWTQLTRGPWVVERIVGVNETAGRIYFVANKESPLRWQLYSMPIAGGDPVVETDADYTNGVVMDGAATRAIVSRSSPTQPGQVYLLDPATDAVQWVERNEVTGAHPYAPFMASHVAPRFGTIRAEDGSELQYKIMTPTLEPGRRYPVFLQVYGGPGAGRQVTAGWTPELQQYLVDRGWIVFSVDGRGTPDRGKAFEDQIYKAMGTVEVADQLRAVEWLKSQPFVDPDRVAVYGWSYGGYMTLKLLQAAPGQFAAGISGAPVTRWGLYDTHYTERYLGNPATDPAPYDASDVVPRADRIRDPLLLIHGMADDNVVFEHSTALMSALQADAVPFETMVYPGQTHRVAGPGVSVHLWRTIENFLNKTVLEEEGTAAGQ